MSDQTLPKMQQTAPMFTVEQLLRELKASRFFGELNLKFQAGEVVYIRKTQTLDLHNLTKGNKDNEQDKK